MLSYCGFSGHWGPRAYWEELRLPELLCSALGNLFPDPREPCVQMGLPQGSWPGRIPPNDPDNPFLFQCSGNFPYLLSLSSFKQSDLSYNYHLILLKASPGSNFLERSFNVLPCPKAWNPDCAGQSAGIFIGTRRPWLTLFSGWLRPTHAENPLPPKPKLTLTWSWQWIGVFACAGLTGTTASHWPVMWWEHSLRSS